MYRDRVEDRNLTDPIKFRAFGGIYNNDSAHMTVPIYFRVDTN